MKFGSGIMVTFSDGKRAVIVVGMCVMSCASFVPDKSGRHFLSSSVALSLRGGGERVHGCFVGVGRHVAARPPAAIGTFSNDKRGEMDRKTAKKGERSNGNDGGGQNTRVKSVKARRTPTVCSAPYPSPSPLHMAGIN